MKRTDITALFPEATKEQIDKLMDLNGADINAAKADMDGLRGQLAAAQAEIAKAKEKPAEDPSALTKIQALEAELNGMKKANTLRELREKVSKDTGVPASLLTAETEEACKSQADAIKAYSDQNAKPASGYPYVRDGGEVHSGGASATRDQFADWINTNFPATN